eukprot:Skav200052  [mRNA]  locus=scaffold337:936769:942143:+ [translate_table: standard]
MTDWQQDISNLETHEMSAFYCPICQETIRNDAGNWNYTKQKIKLYCCDGQEMLCRGCLIEHLNVRGDRTCPMRPTHQLTPWT